jgi:hypothetical protein
MPYSATNWVEGVTTLGPTNMNKIETELVYLDTRIPPAAVGYGTTLPGSPVDGQEYVLVDSTTAPTFQWRFRYNAGSASTYKWEFVGGAPAFNSTGLTSTTAGVWQYPAAAWTLARAGDYLLRVIVRMNQTSGVAATGNVGFALNGAQSGANATSGSWATGTQAPVALESKLSALAAGTTVGLAFYSTSVAGSSISYDTVGFTLTPVRVS